jgi:hypothetical protein
VHVHLCLQENPVSKPKVCPNHPTMLQQAGKRKRKKLDSDRPIVKVIKKNPQKPSSTLSGPPKSHKSSSPRPPPRSIHQLLTPRQIQNLNPTSPPDRPTAHSLGSIRGGGRRAGPHAAAVAGQVQCFGFFVCGGAPGSWERGAEDDGFCFGLGFGFGV